MEVKPAIHYSSYSFEPDSTKIILNNPNDSSHKGYLSEFRNLRFILKERLKLKIVANGK